MEAQIEALSIQEDNYEIVDNKDEDNAMSGQNPEIAMEAQMEALTIEEDSYVIVGDEDEDYRYEVIPKTQVSEEVKLLIAETSEIIQLPHDDTAVLLFYFKWDKMTLTERYFTEDQEELLFKSGVSLMVECVSCKRTLPSREFCIPKCGHRVCFECWYNYFKNPTNYRALRCMGKHCWVLLDEKIARLLKLGAEVYKEVAQTNNYMRSSRVMKECPNYNCTNVFRVESIESRVVKCPCGKSMCMKCGQKGHSPVPCEMIASWRDLSAVKNMHSLCTGKAKCEVCKQEFDKQNHTTKVYCTKCTDNFCWGCNALWKEDKMCCNMRNERLRFFIQRYQYQAKMLDLEITFDNVLEGKKAMMNEMAGDPLAKTWLDHKSWSKAVDSLVACRKVLMNTIVLEFFLQECDQTWILRDKQRELEAAAMTLSERIMRHNQETIYEDLEAAITLSDYCDNKRRALFHFLREGSSRNWWFLIK